MVPYFIAQGATGCGIGLVFGLLILATNTAGLGELVGTSSYPAATGALFLVGSVIVVLPVVIATAIGCLAE